MFDNSWPTQQHKVCLKHEVRVAAALKLVVLEAVVEEVVVDEEAVDGQCWWPQWKWWKRKKKGILTEPLVCARHCVECFTCIMESKLPPTVTYPLFYAPPEKQNHHQSIEGWHPGCIHCEAKETTSLKALHVHRSSQGSQRGPSSVFTCPYFL